MNTGDLLGYSICVTDFIVFNNKKFRHYVKAIYPVEKANRSDYLANYLDLANYREQQSTLDCIHYVLPEGKRIFGGIQKFSRRNWGGGGRVRNFHLIYRGGCQIFR